MRYAERRFLSGEISGEQASLWLSTYCSSFPAESISATNLAQRIDQAHVPAELTGLVSVLNRMFARLEAAFEQQVRFTGDAAQPYRFAAVRSSPNCQARARYVDFAKARPTEASGWKFNDEIRVPKLERAWIAVAAVLAARARP